MAAPATRDPALMAALARGWIYENGPEGLCDRLLAVVDEWAAGDWPGGTLWEMICKHLRLCGCPDAESEACRTALTLFPNNPVFRLRLAECLLRTGADAEALELLRGLSGPEPMATQARFHLLASSAASPQDKQAAIAMLEQVLAEDSSFDNRHRRLVEHMVRLGMTERAEVFVADWQVRWPNALFRKHELGFAEMILKRPLRARSLFTGCWEVFCGTHGPLLGDFHGRLRPYDAAVEAELVERIEAAFALPDDELPVASLPDDPAPEPLGAVMMVSFGHRALPNDFAESFSVSAGLAGVPLRLYLDSALILPEEFVGGDDEVARREEAFIAELERLRPSVVLVDCCWKPVLRGLNPSKMAALRERFDFRLVCVMRDAHRECLSLLHCWLPVCDAMVVFDPLSPIFAAEHAPLNQRVICLPVPTLCPPFLARREKKQAGMVFAGSTSWLPRLALLSVLTTEDIDFTAVVGDDRARLIPDTAAYAHFLGSARAVLNISRHGDGIHLVTGRVWETVATGSLLVEQDNPATASFFQPYRHYLPWTNVEDIAHIAQLVTRRPDLAERIGAEAHAWALRHYGSDRFWTAVLGKALAPRAADAAGLSPR